MKIAIDISIITPGKAGIGYYAHSLVESLAKIDSTNEYSLITNDKKNSNFSKLPKNFQIIEISDDKGGLKWIWKASRMLKKEGFDILISPSNFGFSIFFPRTIQIVHDLAPLKFPQFFTRKGVFMYRLLLNFALRRAYKIGVPSNAIRDELIDYSTSAQNKTFITGEGLHDWTFEAKSKDEEVRVKKQYKLPSKFLLSVSTLEPRKNHLRMIRAFTELSRDEPDLCYVVVGKKGWFYEEIFETVERLGLEDKVFFTGYVPEEDLPYIFDLAKAFLYCSFYEGFGIPPIEAFSRGVPVLASDIKVLREVMGENAIYSDPQDYWDIYQKMKELLTLKKKKTNPDLLSKFSWDECAKNIIKEF
ncbi:MAG: glycosyltransferase family 1 protein [Candidatus Dojkabacteria bacterium]